MGLTDVLGLDLSSLVHLIIATIIVAIGCTGIYWRLHYRIEELAKTMTNHEDRCVQVQSEIKDEIHELKESVERGFQRIDEKQSEIHKRINHLDEDVHFIKGKLDK